MGRARKIARRSFLFGAAALAGGAAFGAWQVARVPANPLHPARGAALSPWLMITPEAITIVVPRAEMGQGVTTTLAAMLAEELEVELAQLSVIHGPPAQAYFNGALFADRTYDNAGDPGGWAAVLTRAVPRVLSLQVTGGSTSVIDGFDKMRVAGAAAREMLLAAAAARLGVGRDRLVAAGGVVRAPDGRELSYHELAEEAARLSPPEDLRLKGPGQWRLLGRSLPRIDQPDKATGRAVFGMDVRLPGMVYASLRMNPHLGGEMRGYDDRAARAMPGVIRVVDLGRGVAVIARSTWEAIEAVRAIEVDWGPAPYPLDTEAIFDRIAAAFDEPANIVSREAGDVEAALAGGAVIRAEYRAPFLAHATMEVMNATAHLTEAGLEVWAPNQSPVQARDLAARAAGVKRAQVRLHTTLMGGGFGRRASVEFVGYAAAIAAAHPGVPVQTTWSREEDTTHDAYRPGAIARMAARLEGGRPVALRAEMAAPSITGQMVSQQVGVALSPADRTLTEGAHDQPYAIENIRVSGHAADLDIPVGFWRSVGNSQNAFFWESFIDELAHAAGADPLQFRLDLIRPEHMVSALVLEDVAALSGWGQALPAGVGRGVAFTHSFGAAVAQVVEVARTPAGLRLNHVWIAADVGRALDPRNIEAQLTGGALFGLSAAITGQITFAEGRVEQENFPDMDPLRINAAPRFSVKISERGARIAGVGEIATPPAAPALANAVFALTGQRIRHLPLSRAVDFAL